MARMLDDLTVEELKKHLTYDSETGLFTRNRNGKIAGIEGKNPYTRVCVWGNTYLAHRLAWFYVHSEWPDGLIDHINMNTRDNRICNLRVVSHSENAQNSLVRINSSTGIKGVYRSRNRWKVQIKAGGKQLPSKSFVDIMDAESYAIEAYKKYHKCNPYQGESSGTDS